MANNTDGQTDEAAARNAFANETARRLKAFGDGLHGLARVDTEADTDGSGRVRLAVEYFANDAERDGSGDAARLFEHCAEMGLNGDIDAPEGLGRGAFGVVEFFTLG